MRKKIKHLEKVASIVHSALLAARAVVPLPDLPNCQWRECLILLERSRRARRYGWRLAADRLAGQLQTALGTLTTELQEYQSAFGELRQFSNVSSYRDIYRDLLQLEEHFDSMHFDRSGHLLTVRTESIDLEEIDFGPFEIRLNLGNLRGNQPYRVVALEPNRATARPEVIHPHVLDELVCEGEGRVAIRKALREGRFEDFFQLVAGILRTYNDDSPYVELADWNSEPCCDCGMLIHPDYGFCCPHCESWLCYECEGTCLSCGEGSCHQCLALCKHCEDLFCDKCLETCSGCLEQFCPVCLANNERCGDCDEHVFNESECSAPVAVLSHGVGQADVST